MFKLLQKKKGMFKDMIGKKSMLKNGGAESSMLKLLQKKKGMSRESRKIQYDEIIQSMLKKIACARTEVFADDLQLLLLRNSVIEVGQSCLSLSAKDGLRSDQTRML
jgi:hypothetical protein